MSAPASPGTAIRRARERKRWTQQDLASRLGVSPRTVSDWENDRASPRSSTGAIEEVLGISLSGGEAEQPPEGIPDLDGLVDRARAIVADNWHDPIVRDLWGLDRISRDARLGLVDKYLMVCEQAERDRRRQAESDRAS